MEDKIEKIIIECECGSHLLKVDSNIEFIEGENSPVRYRQEFYLAMFTYGTRGVKPGFWERLGIAWRVIKSGTMHRDQLILNEDEAEKLSKFIADNLVHGTL